MPDLDDAIRALYEARERHRQRIEQIEQALELLRAQDVSEDLFALEIPRPTAVREAILAVLTDARGELLDVSTLLREALARGWRSTSSNPRNTLASTLAKLADAGEIERGGRGQYRALTPDTAFAAA